MAFATPGNIPIARLRAASGEESSEPVIKARSEIALAELVIVKVFVTIATVRIVQICAKAVDRSYGLCCLGR